MAATVALSSHQTSSSSPTTSRLLLCLAAVLLTGRASSSISSRLPNIRELIPKQSRTHNLPGLKARKIVLFLSSFPFPSSFVVVVGGVDAPILLLSLSP